MVSEGRTRFKKHSIGNHDFAETGSPDDEPEFRRALANANWVPAVPEISATYTELVSTGRLSDLDNTNLRNALTSYGNTYAQTRRVYEGAAMVVFDPHSNYYRAVDWAVEPKYWETDQAIVSYDWEILRNSRAEMQAWLPFQDDLSVYGKQQLEDVRRIIVILQDETSGSEDTSL